MTEEKVNNWIQTYSGKKFNPLDPDPSLINILDIGHALSNLCRYGGHCSNFYSVGQHSVIVANFIYKETKSKEKAMSGLLHDASEAYMVDIPRPIKQHLHDYKQYEDTLLDVIFKKFNQPRHAEIVHIADNRVLMTEAKYLMGDPQDWNIPYEPIDEVITPLSPRNARELFYHTFNNLLTETNIDIKGIDTGHPAKSRRINC